MPQALYQPEAVRTLARAVRGQALQADLINVRRNVSLCAVRLRAVSRRLTHAQRLHADELGVKVADEMDDRVELLEVCCAAHAIACCFLTLRCTRTGGRAPAGLAEPTPDWRRGLPQRARADGADGGLARQCAAQAAAAGFSLYLARHAPRLHRRVRRVTAKSWRPWRAGTARCSRTSRRTCEPRAAPRCRRRWRSA